MSEQEVFSEYTPRSDVWGEKKKKRSKVDV